MACPGKQDSKGKIVKCKIIVLINLFKICNSSIKSSSMSLVQWLIWVKKDVKKTNL